ncbi:helix-turn-helix transcriptional regulator [Amycolatopsis sp.]|jgi:predicted transcriptional regulator YheO|uniref:helix-turn-helix transcriptional regulator n=1 Tax=Amycolatopsis sp. TaxID=37632 RepID=UPI002E0CDA75|nr:PAS domain-containing protein [Amycolatopsis sp.]
MELPSWAERMTPTCQAIAELLHPNAEVVLHDLGTDTIVGIWNAFSARQVGEASLVSELPGADDDGAVIGPYEKVALDGRRLTSISAVIRDDEGTTRGMLCVNLDRSPLDSVVAALTSLAASPTVQPRVDALFERDWREQIALSVDEWCRSRNLRREALTRSDRVDIIRVLDEQDLFATRKAAEHAATALGVSRATVYQLLRSARTSAATKT